ncbi:alpha-amylase-related protein-like [Physella acuta]|uniref:alpha-amylase-related protein-like n=1 Tax=Physella acuta TaxID=109671 RepID=UPI0027DE0530|nr:alpha-amylase-related protein-like [Physella acuta]
MTPSDHALVFVDNQDTQRAGHLHFNSPLPYMQAVAFTFAYDYGLPVLTSSYYFLDAETPPPHDGDVIKDVIINNDGTFDNGWVCEHRFAIVFGAK